MSEQVHSIPEAPVSWRGGSNRWIEGEIASIQLEYRRFPLAGHQIRELLQYNTLAKCDRLH